MVARLRAAGEKPEPNAKTTIPSAAKATTGANEMTSEPMAKRATDRRLMRRSLPWALIPRLTSSLLRAGSPTRRRTRFTAARTVIKTLAYSKDAAVSKPRVLNGGLFLPTLSYDQSKRCRMYCKRKLVDWRPRADTKKADRTAMTLCFKRGRNFEKIVECVAGEGGESASVSLEGGVSDRRKVSGRSNSGTIKAKNVNTL